VIAREDAMPQPDGSTARPIQRVGLVARAGLRAAAPVLAEMTAWLEARGVTVVLEADTAALAGLSGDHARASRADLARRADLIVVLGGDGTLLGMADRIAEAGADVPILGVNFGSLGFLTEVTLEEIPGALATVLAGTARIEARLMLRSRVLRAEACMVERVVLNDVVVARGPLAPITELSVSVGPDLVTSVRADGLIVATPTGSTAYNLACGGPILHPAVDALVLTPIAPHTLTNRPVVIPARSEVRIQAAVTSSDGVVATFDGHDGYPLQPGDVVSILAAPRPMRLVRGSTRTYFEVLRQKLKWGER
jgi:NAD+ kinase